MPLDARLSRTPGEHDAGPMVHISFVRRVLRKPVARNTQHRDAGKAIQMGIGDHACMFLDRRAALLFLEVRAARKGGRGGRTVLS